MRHFSTLVSSLALFLLFPRTILCPAAQVRRGRQLRLPERASPGASPKPAEAVRPRPSYSVTIVSLAASQRTLALRL